MYDLTNDLAEMHKEYDRKREDATHQTAIAFVEHLKKLIKKSASPSSSSIQITKKELYEEFTYPLIAKKVWLGHDKKNYSENEQGHSCARRKNLIEIDYDVRPYKYTILENSVPEFELRPYQNYIIDDADEAKGSVLIEAPTGAGKSIMASEIAKREVSKGGKVLIVAPKLILLDQLHDTFKDLNPQIIHGAKDYDTQHNVFISTIQTAHNRDLGFEPTMILIDEVHFGFSGKMIKSLLSDFSGRLIGLSATPYDQKGVPLQGFDLHINEYNLRYMIENKYLFSPKCYAPLKVDLSKVSMVGGDYNQSDLDREFNNMDNISKIVESTKDKILERKAALIFCINIIHSEAVAKAFSNAGVPTKAIHSQLSKEEQKTIMSEYKSGKLKMLANPMMLTTGFDYPDTDTIVLARATQSQNLYRQMVGRALRLSEGKTDAVILDCSNVIANLGLPTLDIVKRDSSARKSISVCTECESERIYKKIINNYAYMMCADCGHFEDIMEEGYACEKCGLFHSSKAKFKTVDNNLYLVCNDCEHETLVSESSTKEEMSLIFDPIYINTMQTSITLTYLKYLMKKENPAFILKPEVTKHIKALHSLILKEPSLFVDTDFSSFSYSMIVKVKNKYKWQMEWNKGWRSFDEEMEDEILNEGLKDLNDLLKESNDFRNSIHTIQNILKLTKEEPLETSFIQEIIDDINKSKLQNIDSICNKRVKDLYFNKKDLYSMRGFVGMMESVL